MPEIFGLDFGTTNSLISIIIDGKVRSLTREGDMPYPSAIWYNGTEIIAGVEAKRHLRENPAGEDLDAVRSPKRLLGRDELITFAGIQRKSVDVVSEVLRNLVLTARECHRELKIGKSAIAAIPVNFTGTARRNLRQAAAMAGIEIMQFVHEPLAALYGYLRNQGRDLDQWMSEYNDKLILVVDWGGGTLDITLCKLLGYLLTQVRSTGTDEVGGDVFDTRIRRKLQDRHIATHQLSALPELHKGALPKLLEEAEVAKIRLSTQDAVSLVVDQYARLEGNAGILETAVTVQDLHEWTDDLVNKGMDKILNLLEQCHCNVNDIALCLVTGGMSQMPRIRARIIELFGIARVPSNFSSDRAIAEGAAWIGYDGLQLALAKPVEFLHADNTYVSILPKGTVLPSDDGIPATRLDLYCADPRDGKAKFEIARPTWPKSDLNSITDERSTHECFTLPVDSDAEPFFERLKLLVEINRDLVMYATASSDLTKEKASVEILDLEFGLDLRAVQEREPDVEDIPSSESSYNNTNHLPVRSLRDRSKASLDDWEAEMDREDSDRPRSRVQSDSLSIQERKFRRGDTKLSSSGPGALRFRSNIAESNDPTLVPGELMYERNPYYFQVALNPPLIQRNERMYYSPCCLCGRLIHEIKRDGCDREGCPDFERKQFIHKSDICM